MICRCDINKFSIKVFIIFSCIDDQCEVTAITWSVSLWNTLTIKGYLFNVYFSFLAFVMFIFIFYFTWNSVPGCGYWVHFKLCMCDTNVCEWLNTRGNEGFAWFWCVGKCVLLGNKMQHNEAECKILFISSKMKPLYFL